MSQEILLTCSTLLWAGAAGCLCRWFGPAWDAVVGRYIADLRKELDALGVDNSRLANYLRVWGSGLVAGFLFLWLVCHMLPIALAFAGICFWAPRYVLRTLIGRRALLFRDQLVPCMVALANASRAGLSLAQGLDKVAADAAEPLASELRRICFDYHRGRPLQAALDDTRNRLRLEGFSLFSSAVSVNLERGGRLTETLERISKSLQEHQRLERKLLADTQSGRKVITILGVFPLVFLLGVSVLEPQGTAFLFSSLGGQLLLVLVGLLVFLAVYWSSRILKIDF